MKCTPGGLAHATLVTALALGAPLADAGEARHPLDPLSALEIRTISRALDAAGHLTDEALLPLVTLDEPDKEAVLGWSRGEPSDRRGFAVVKIGERTFEGVVDLGRGDLLSWREVPGVQAGILLNEEWGTAGAIVREHDGWRSAVAERGLEDPGEVVLVPLTAGNFGAPLETSDRIVKVLSFDGRGVNNFWARPIEGLIAVVSLDRGEVVELIDRGVVPIPGGAVDFDEAQPRAAAVASSTGCCDLEGQFVRWGSWSFHWRVDPRLGPVLSLIEFNDRGRPRSVLYQASLSEMFVPYTDPDAGWYFRAYMDAGEYGLGKLSSRLQPGLDCPADASFLNSWFVDDWGNAYRQERVACLFERSVGDFAWRHFESESGRTAGAPASELVFRSVPSIGNYDYVLDWIFRPDGSIRVSVGATGVPQVRATRSRGPSDEAAYGRWVAEHTVAVNHDHFFSFRLDFDVDGAVNSFVREAVRRRSLEGGPRTATWVLEPQVAETETQARLQVDLARPALWRVVNPSRKGPLGYPVSYRLRPGRNAVSLFGPTSFVERRAGFIAHHLWVTPYARGERYAAGDYPNQSRGGAGLPAWTARDRPIRDRDIVLWYTLGMRHVVRAEDWPVMPTSTSDFEILPFDFFPRNPLLEREAEETIPP